ncbi:hypothetical protein GCM10012275_59870 [Longimycelium tulufanense]|uniref:IrrE N-terminal-like domain-containing protein n=1 Tax=Longimycelium tulufanense TaxID=907463 RepID=A0A8J3CED2_9PSEU|nr:hypothetical protein [Longimycelium tulufanense]GGM81253.1 hypothetical protein GCM10012275_59870 [Longimycelium tulufanense]
MVSPFDVFREWVLRRQCRSLLRDLDVPAPLNVRDLCRRLGEARGRPIELYEYPLEVPGPFGLWFRLPDRDAIFYQQGSVPWHQDHIILHELGHLLRGHPSGVGALDPATAAILRNPAAGLEWDIAEEETDGDEDLRRRRRTCYDDRYEREAELYATIIQEWCSVLTADPAPGGDPAERRISQSLSHHQGWR